MFGVRRSEFGVRQITPAVKTIDNFFRNDFLKRVRQFILNRLKKNINNPKQSNKFIEDNDHG